MKKGATRKYSFALELQRGIIMRKYKQLVALLLSAGMMVSTVGCGSAVEETQSQVTKETSSQVVESEVSKDVSEELLTEVTQITLYPATASLESGIRGGYMGDLMASYGVEVDVWAYSADKTNAIMASGDLPDIMYVNAENLEILIEGDMVLELSDYLDEIDLSKVEGIDTALNFIREFRSAGTGGVYAMPVAVGPGSNDGTTERNALKIFWKYYDAAGFPEFNTMEEIIPIVKQIQEQNPTDAMGNKVYGVGSYYAASDMHFINGYATIFGYASQYYKYMGAGNMIEGEIEYLLEEDGILHKALKWYNTMYREGLFDPNSINMDRSTHQSMISNGGENGTYILSLIDSPGWEPNYMALAFDEEKIFYPNYSPYGNSNQYIVVNAKTKNLDGCLNFLRMCADPDAYLAWRSLPDGEKWYSKDGVAVPTEAGLEALLKGNEFTTSTGEAERLWNTNPIVNTGTPTSYKDTNGNYREPMVQNWSEVVAAKMDTENGNSWRNHYGAATTIELFESEGILKRNSRLMNANSFLESPSDEQKLIIDALADTIVTASWKMIYAETDGDFDSLWNKMISDAEGLGAKDIYDWCCENVEKAVSIKESLEK